MTGLPLYNHLFDPPYDSPLEEELARCLCNLLLPELNFHKQWEVRTQIGSFRGDFLISNGKTNLILEVDGKEFHKGNYDRWRDACILGEKKVDAIIRFKGKDIHHNLHECVFALSYLYPNFFSERSRSNLKNLLIQNSYSTILENIEESLKSKSGLIFLNIQYEVEDKHILRNSIEINYQTTDNEYLMECYQKIKFSGLTSIESVLKKFSPSF